MARPTVTSAYLRHEAEHYLIDDVKAWGLLRAAANTIEELEARLAAVATEHQENDK